MEQINPQTKMEDVTDMVQVNNRLLVCSGEEEGFIIWIPGLSMLKE